MRTDPLGGHRKIEAIELRNRNEERPTAREGQPVRLDPTPARSEAHAESGLGNGEPTRSAERTLAARGEASGGVVGRTSDSTTAGFAHAAPAIT